MISRLTIVMYHYVRDVERTAFPGIKARSVAAFRGQLDYIRRHYRLVTAAELAQACSDTAATLPSNAALLTFDDGYIDHYSVVAPILADLGLSAVVAPVGKAVLEGKVLDVNKIHFILAAMQDRIDQVVAELFALLDRYRDTWGLEANQAYWSRLAQPNRFDPAEIIFLKRMLQRDLPIELRNVLVDSLFRRYVTADEHAFAAELYMNLDQLRELSRAGIGIACHGYDHLWLGTLSQPQQVQQIRRSLDFLSLVTDTAAGWIFTYPYGSHSPALLDLAREHGCIAGFTTDVAIASSRHNPLLLPRLDTNDLPTTGNADPVEWTATAISVAL
ncbi:MAG TPA: polysaccharide deacetylase family protein [Tepidisphaeraceae bacterium]|nr:polysaccharide deacetylase family protein [Tepidisphaeraceae bacterium]